MDGTWHWREITTLLLVLALLWVAPTPQSVGAQEAISCNAVAWMVTDADQLDAAITCWETAASIGDRTITLADSIDRSILLDARGAQFPLAIEGAGHAVDGLSYRGNDEQERTDLAELRIRNLRLTGALELQNAVMTAEDVEVTGTTSQVAVDVTDGDLTLRRAYIHDNEGGVRASNSATPASRVWIVDSAIERSFAGPGVVISSSVVIVENSIIRDNSGGVVSRIPGEVLIDGSSLVDNDRYAFTAGGTVTSSSGTMSIINSTIADHDLFPLIGLLGGGVHAAEGPGLRIANSTVVGNDSNDLLGPVASWSSAVQSCDPGAYDDLYEFDVLFPFGPTDGTPSDMAASAGGCFGDWLAWHPLADNGCVRATPVGCAPTIALDTSTAPTGECRDTLIRDPAFDLFSFDIEMLDPSVDDPMMVTMGTQPVDQTGAPRTRCTVGALEATSSTSTDDLTVLSWDLADRRCCPDGLAGELIDALEGVGGGPLPDIVVLHGTAGFDNPDFLGCCFGLVERLRDELARRGLPWTARADWAYTESNNALMYEGQIVLSRLPIVGEATVRLPHPDPVVDRSTFVRELILQPNGEPVRLLALNAIDSDPCTSIDVLDDWLASQPEMATVWSAAYGSDVATRCVADVEARWIDACTPTIPASACGPTDDARTASAIHHRNHADSEVALLRGATIVTPEITAVGGHRPILARYSLTGADGDLDTDAVATMQDNCPTDPNPDQSDIDDDGVGDDCDPILQGDANCDGQRDIIDALVIAQWSAAVREAGEDCPLASATTHIDTIAADVNRDGVSDIVDALLVAQCSAGIPAPSCPDPSAR